MKFVVDAQLPIRLVTHLAALGHDALHVASLPGGDRMPDPEIAALADEQGRVVVTKDSDFRHSHRVSGSPAKLLLVVTGNIRNDDLLALIGRRLGDIVTAFGGSSFVELHRDVLVAHADDADEFP